MEIKKNVYLVLTEYQFLQAVNIATSVYHADKYINLIYLVRKGNRLKGIDVNKPMNINNTWVLILDDTSPKEIAYIIINQKPNHFLFFQEGFTINRYLSHKLSQKGVEISLGPDGYKAYARFNKKFWFLSFLKDSYEANKYLIKNKLLPSRILFFDYYTYCNDSSIDNLWISHPEEYLHRSKNKVKIIKLPDYSKQCINFINYCFDFKESFPLENAIYYFNQPFRKTLKDKEFEFLNHVLEHFPDKQIILKLHPLTDPEIKSCYQKLNRLLIIESSVPAEVIILQLKNCIAFTGWSSVLMTENKSCNYYFNYNIYKDITDISLNQLEIFPLKHIKMINRPQEMKFPDL